MSMNTVTKTAWANMKKNKNRNILTGIAIALTSILIVAVLSVGNGMIKIQFAAVNNIYPTFHTMYRQVSKENTEKLKKHADIEQIGVREDMGIIKKDNTETLLIYMDNMASKQIKQKLESGNWPKSKNEIVVSQGLLDNLLIEGKIGSEITLNFQPIEQDKYRKERTEKFVISGILPTSKEVKENGMYAALVSEEFLNEVIPREEQEYRVTLRFKNADSMTTDEIEAKAKAIAKDFNVDKVNVVMNTEYLMANYVDPAFFAGIVGVIIIIMLAGILTIYSIYYVSMIDKVQEFGKLKALGATKRQIKQMVFREGIFVSSISIPIGIIIGIITTRIVLVTLMNGVLDNPTNVEMKRVFLNGEVSYITPFILILAVLVTLCTVIISLIRPMIVASKISPIEAMRYDGEMKGKKKVRKGYDSINLFRLTCSNLSRNKKRTTITILTMGATGILFIVLSTALICSEPREVAKEQIYHDFQLTVDYYSGDEMRPEKNWNIVQQNNPLDEKMEQQIMGIDGVKEIRKTQTISGKLLQDDKDNIYINGIAKNEEKTLREGFIEGSPSYDELLNGDKVILNERYLYWYPDWKLGDNIKVKLYNGEKDIEKELEIAAIGKYNEAFSDNMFMVPMEVVEKFSDYNLVSSYDIAIDKKKQEEVNKELEDIVKQSNGTLELESYEKIVEEWKSSMDLMSQAVYAFMIILGMVGILNLINTMIYSIHTRRKELGILQTIGMSEKQLMKMLQMEGIFYTIGTLIVSLGIGNICGYCFYIYAKNNGILSITTYHYPTLQTILLVLTVVIIQLALTCLVNQNYHKQSLIERIRAAE